MKRGIYLMFVLLLVLAGCKTGRKATAPLKEKNTEELLPASRYLSSKLRLTVPGKKGTMTVGGVLKMKTGDRVQISVLMPVFRAEMARLEITPDEVLVVDRMNKRFVRATREELNQLLPGKAEFSYLERLLLKAAQPGGKSELTASDLGLPAMDKALLQLYDFSSHVFELVPTALTDRYVEVSWQECMKLWEAL